ncbi:DEAD-box ATP-dependent RNA helicase 50 [Ananas comosus]|uniref:DEAD-box ATP-dependent RNA helicase 50 n=1 Tax=Ananas comosus TaxID=4615 RepID=A0A6P5G6U7_ANACO|nr:DEAD-box ATP-dependent RNA helicase 50 [Ananas comosus]
MLARAPQSPFSNGLVPIPRPHLHLPPPPSSASTAGARRGTRRWGPARAERGGGGGYERVPMETPGAYRLVDKATGDGVIVWGGADDGEDAPIPSDEVLSWSTRRREEKGFEMVPGAADFTSKPVSSVGTFGRLKAQKVKSLIRKSSRISRERGNLSADDADHVKSFQLTRKEKSKFGVIEREELNSSVVDEEVQDTSSLPIGSIQNNGSAGVLDSKFMSRGWGDAASGNNATLGRSSHRRKSSSDSDFFSKKSFKDLGCSDDMIKSLRNLMFLRPSHIQALAFRPVLEGKSCIIADQSGSGKTLAYLAPVIQCIRQEEVLGLGKSSSRSPRVIILAPTAELASQVLSNCRSISKFGVPFRSMVATGGFRQKTQLETLEQDLDVLVATPGRFLYLLHEGFLQLTNLKCVVLDEVDILFGDEGFEQVLQRLVSSAPVSAQYLFVTATLPLDIYNKVVEVFPDCEVIMGPGMHRTSSRLEEVLVDCSGEDGEEKSPDTAFSNKRSALLQLVEESPVPKTIIFCNKIETCRKVENVLNRFDRKGSHIKILPFHAALAQEMRLANIKEFLNSQSADSMFLICTDRASRGIDFANVDHVVLFDLPRDPSEYIRRVGRTARGAGGTGKAYVFAVGKQVSLARKIMERNKKGHPLHDLPCAYELHNSVL